MKNTLLAIMLILSGAAIWVFCQPDVSRLEQQLAQKIMLDLRYYCPEMSSADIVSGEQKCTTPMTKLPKEVAELIKETSLGSVILFAENLHSIEQIIQLTSDLQGAALASDMQQPLFISIDQEGGRVVRLPRSLATSFTGNMSIGSTYKRDGITLAQQVGEAIGAELQALGINVNHAPSVDVNVNPRNPVINVRSFSHDPKVVAELGIATVNGMQSQGVLATLKHFPGHGDTDVDSHHGLPVVHHNQDVISRVDLYPFQQAIDNTNVNMIMTAHIQYPELDNSMVINKFEQRMVRPATISKAILTDLLRDKMGYEGLIITDALDMAGIANFFTPVEATLNTFEAGSDIAMMPMAIRTREDIDGFKRFLNTLAIRVNEESEIKRTIGESVARVVNIKHLSIAKTDFEQPLSTKIQLAEKILGNEKHRALEKRLAQRGLASYINNQQVISALKQSEGIHLVAPEYQQAKALEQFINDRVTLLDLPDKRISSLTMKASEAEQLSGLSQSGVVIVAVDGMKSVVMTGGAEDAMPGTQHKQGKANFLDILKMAKQQGKSTVLVSLNLPVENKAVNQYADWVITTFDDSTHYNRLTERYQSPALSALALQLFE